jgi:hypothetical protein
MTYSEKLKDPRWQKKRLEIFQRDNWTCVSCSSKEKTLNVHHRKYIKGKEPWDYELDDLWTMCEECHKRLTEFEKQDALDTVFFNNVDEIMRKMKELKFDKKYMEQVYYLLFDSYTDKIVFQFSSSGYDMFNYQEY